MFKSYKQVIDAWGKDGGTVADALRAFAADIQITDNTAKQMRRRDSIPANYWPRVAAKAASRGISGVSIDLLAELRSAKAERLRRTARRARPKTRTARSLQATA